MVTQLSHVTLLVTDQEKAYDFYVNKLGCRVTIDQMVQAGNNLPAYRWLTVSPAKQSSLDIILMPAVGLPAEELAALKLLLEKGMMGAFVFNTDDCVATFNELKERGVVFLSEPKEKPYGIEAIMSDGCGNWHSLTQRKEGTLFV